MKVNKSFLLVALTALLLVSLVSAGDFIIRNSTGTNLLTLDNVTGDFNITSGTISENGVLLSDLYCLLAGCTMSGGLNVTTLNVTTSVDFPSDSISEGDINFNTSCGAGNHLYISGNDLACEADDDTTYDNSTPISLTGTTFGLVTCGDNEVWKMSGASWNCEADATGSGGNTTEEMQDAVLNSINGMEGITYAYDDTGNQGNITFDCSEVTDSGGDHLSCSDEDLVVDDDFVLNTGDTITTGDLNLSGVNLDLQSDANITGGGSTTFTIDATGNLIITLG